MSLEQRLVAAFQAVGADIKQLQAQAAPSVFFRTEAITATVSGQTSFTVPGGYTPGAIFVSLNGAALAPTDFAAINGTTVVLASGAGIVVGSVLLVYVLTAFQVADALPILGIAADSSKLGGIPAENYPARSELGSFAYADYAAAPFVNLMPDSGRFGGKVNPLTLALSSSFSASPFLSSYNGGTWASGGKFTHNNASYGGAGAALNSDVQALLLAMGREESGPDGNSLRYGVEFHIGKYTAGSATSSPAVGADNTTRYLALVNGSRALFGARGQCTFVAWVKVLSGSIHIGVPTATPDLYRNGSVTLAPLDVVESDGWVHLRHNMVSRPGYQTGFPFFYASPGAVFLIACPAFFSGIVDTGLHPAPIATLNELIA